MGGFIWLPLPSKSSDLVESGQSLRVKHMGGGNFLPYCKTEPSFCLVTVARSNLNPNFRSFVVLPETWIIPSKKKFCLKGKIAFQGQVFYTVVRKRFCVFHICLVLGFICRIKERQSPIFSSLAVFQRPNFKSQFSKKKFCLKGKIAFQGQVFYTVVRKRFCVFQICLVLGLNCRIKERHNIVLWTLGYPMPARKLHLLTKIYRVGSNRMRHMCSKAT